MVQEHVALVRWTPSLDPLIDLDFCSLNVPCQVALRELGLQAQWVWVVVQMDGVLALRLVLQEVVIAVLPDV